MSPLPVVWVFLFIVAALGRPAVAGPPKEPAEDTFQQAIARFQAGDKVGASKLFMTAARAGNSKANVQVGWCYEFGEGVQQNLSEAAKWYRTAADLGNSRGQKNLGALYEAGGGVREDWVEAAKWYQKSAAQQDPDGQAALARAYQFGIGVPQSRMDAIVWDQKAATQGNADSAYFVRWLSSPTNNIGFRNAAEHNAVIGYRMVDVVVQNEPTGVLFHNAAERMEYLAEVAQQLENDEVFSHWWLARGEYTRCRAAQRSYCRDPGPSPR
jgi:TPR repeat protein